MVSTENLIRNLLQMCKSEFEIITLSDSQQLKFHFYSPLSGHLIHYIKSTYETVFSFIP